MNTSAPAAPSDSSWKVYAKAGGIYARSSNAEVGPFGAAAAATFVGWDIYNSGNIALNNGSETSITFNSERLDSDGFHDTGSNTHLVTIPTGKGGKYLVGASTDTTSSVGAGAYIAIIKNGTSYIATGSIVNVAGYTGGNVTRLISLAQTDTLQVKVLANAGSKNALAAADYSPEFWGVKVAD